MKVDNILQTIGNTPHVRINRLFGPAANVWVKSERSNPGGSIKDRIALSMVEDAEKSGALKPGGTIIEPTSCNTGIGLALVAAVKGYKLILVMPDSMSIERRRLMLAYGAQFDLTPREKGMKGAIGSAAITVRTMGCGACTELPYCPTEGGDSEDEWIARVKFGEIDHSSGDDGGYGDHTDVSTTMEVGYVDTIRIEPGHSGFQFNERYHVWIDLDQNGTFDAPNERVFAPTVGSNQPVQGLVEIPANTTLGQTRMRVIMRYSLAPVAPCATSFDYGEVEDYCINFILNSGNSVRESTTDLDLLIHPVPPSESATIRSARANGGVQVIDATGRTVLNERMNGDLHVLGTSSLAEGSYTVLVVHGNELVERGRLMVIHSR